MIRKFVGGGFILGVSLALSMGGVSARGLDSDGSKFPRIVEGAPIITDTAASRIVDTRTGSAPPVIAQTEKSNFPTQCVLPTGTEFWFPGQVTPYPLYADTAARKLVYSAPDGYVVIYKSWKTGESTSTSTRLVPLNDQWCNVAQS
jgi:hypothetical protein